MKLYEIDQAIQDVMDSAEINEETGELTINESLLKMLEDQRDQKIEGLIGYYKNLSGDVDKFDSEIKNLTRRKQVIKNKQDSLKKFLDFLHNGEKREYGVHKINYRKSSVLVGDDLSVLPDNYIKTKIEPDKKSIKEAISKGLHFKGWAIEERQNIQIK